MLEHPEVIAAGLALIGALCAAFVSFRIAQGRIKLEKRLAEQARENQRLLHEEQRELFAEQDSRFRSTIHEIQAKNIALELAVQTLQQDAAKSMLEAQQKFQAELSALQRLHERNLVKIKADIEHELSEKRMREAMNQHNLRRTSERIHALKDTWAQLLFRLRRICEQGQDMDDDAVLDETLEIVTWHRQFRDRTNMLSVEIRPEDFDRLMEFYKYQGKVVLDVGRTKKEREHKHPAMLAHVRYLLRESAVLMALAAEFLQFRKPSSLPPSRDALISDPAAEAP